MTAQPNRMDASDDELRAALECANLPTLLMVLAHLTGDHSWLEEPYRPDRTKALDDNDTAGLPAHRQAEVRSAAWHVLRQWRDGRIPAPSPLSDRQIVEMLSVCMGEPVPDEYGPMLAEEAGFRRRDVEWSGGPSHDRLADYQVVVIGAGISGICAAIKLRELGIPYVVLDKNDAVGGTWLENDYPGAGVDTPSHLYSFSFAPNPSWSQYYAKQEEILAYMGQVAEEHGIMPDVRLGTEVVSAIFDEIAHRWEVVARESDGTQRTYHASIVISSVGQLNRPQIPSIPGLESFPGPKFHSAHWRHDVELTGKRVGVLGTGASAMQIVPAIAGTPAELVVFQRSPQWAAPNPNYLRPVADGTRLLMEQVPYYATWYRMRLLWMFNDKLHPSLQIDPTWPYPDRAVNAINDKHRQFFTDYIREQLPGREDLWGKVLPTYPPYGKRILMDNNWFTTVARDDVQLVTEDVERVDGSAVVTADGTRHEVDVLVLATGFQSKRMLSPMDVRGSGGRLLREEWGDDDARAYLGMTVPGFPNLFLLYGPNTNLGHGGSVIFHAECQVNYATRLITMMAARGISSVDCRREVFAEYNARVDAAHERMIWTHPGMDTWYRNARGRVVTNSPWRLRDYWAMTHRPAIEDFVVSFRGPARDRRPA